MSVEGAAEGDLRDGEALARGEFAVGGAPSPKHRPTQEDRNRKPLPAVGADVEDIFIAALRAGDVWRKPSNVYWKT